MFKNKLIHCITVFFGCFLILTTAGCVFKGHDGSRHHGSRGYNPVYSKHRTYYPQPKRYNHQPKRYNQPHHYNRGKQHYKKHYQWHKKRY